MKVKAFTNHEACPEFEIVIKPITESKTIAQVSNKRKYIVIREDMFDQLSENELYIILRWCYHKHNINSSKPISYKFADRKTIKDCINIGLEKRVIFNTFHRFLEVALTPLNVDRLRLLHITLTSN